MGISSAGESQKYAKISAMPASQRRKYIAIKEHRYPLVALGSYSWRLERKQDLHRHEVSARERS